MLGMEADMERKFIRERRQTGIEAAKAKGIYKGRKPSVPVAKVQEMRAAGQGPTAIDKALGISRMSVYRACSLGSWRLATLNVAYPPIEGTHHDFPPHFFEGSYSAEARRI